MARDLYKQRMVDYFKKNLKKGYSSDTLKWAIINQGYSRIIVENAMEDAMKDMAKNAPILEEKPIIKHEIIDENNQPVEIKKPWWKKIFG